MSVLTETPEPMSRRERERLQRRREILDAARAVFAEKGYSNATLDEVAQRAEYAKGTIYNYFASKDDLLLAIFDDLYDDLNAIIEARFSPSSMEGRSLEEVFHGFVRAYMEHFFQHRELFLILVKEAYRMVFSDDREKACYFQQQRERMVSAMVPTLEHAIARGEMKPLPAVAVANMLLGNVNGMQMHIALEGLEEVPCDPVLHTSDAAAAFLTTMLCDGLLDRS